LLTTITYFNYIYILYRTFRPLIRVTAKTLIYLYFTGAMVHALNIF